MTRCDTCGNDLDRMEAPSVNTCNGDFCLICAGREIERLHKLESDQRWRKWPEEKPEEKDEYMTIIDDEGNDDTCLLFWNGSEFCLRGGFRPLVRYWRPIGELPKEQGEK